MIFCHIKTGEINCEIYCILHLQKDVRKIKNKEIFKIKTTLFFETKMKKPKVVKRIVFISKIIKMI